MEKVHNFLNQIIKPNDSVVIATSGGPDSMALLNIMLKISKRINIKIICAHVNHNTGRIGQNEEEQFVKRYCHDNKIIFESMKINDYTSNNFESEARIKRYEYFDKLIKRYNAKYLLTAHHGDDLIETILMRIVRGSTLKGYSGFSEVSDMDGYKILRPLIQVTKEEIVEYNKKNKIKYFIDNTNYDDIHTRNRYRKYILPRLKKEDKNVHLKFYKFSKVLDEYNSYIDLQVKNVVNDLYNENILDLEKFNKMDYLISIQIISYILKEIYKNDIVLINDNHTISIYNLAKSSKANSMVYLPHNIRVIKKYNKLEFKAENNKLEDYRLQIRENLSLSNNCKLSIINQSELDNNYICRLSKDDVKLPLYVRNKRDGDKMYVKGLNGRKKISDIFIDSKINVLDRNIWPVVTDSNDIIVWIPGLKKSKFDKTKNEKYDIILKYN